MRFTSILTTLLVSATLACAQSSDCEISISCSMGGQELCNDNYK